MTREANFEKCPFLKEETKNFINSFLKKYNTANLLYVKFKKSEQSDGVFKIFERNANIRNDTKNYFNIFCYIPNFKDRKKVKFNKRGAMYESLNRSIIACYPHGSDIPKIKDILVKNDTDDPANFLQERLVQSVESGGVVEATYSIFKANRIVWETEKFKTIDEIAVWIFGREMYHFLIKTNQIRGEDKLEKAFEFGVGVLRGYRRYIKEHLDFSRRREKFVHDVRMPKLIDIITPTITITTQKKEDDTKQKEAEQEEQRIDKTLIKNAKKFATIYEILLKYQKHFDQYESHRYICYKCKKQFSSNQSVEWVNKRKKIFKCPNCSEILEAC